MYGYWLGMNVVWWFFWAVVVFALFAWLTPVPRWRARSPDDPLAVLKRRYAAGEITTAEYDERRVRLADEHPVAREPAHRPGVAVPPRSTPPEVEHHTSH